ncbi:conserved hypothetical protein [Alteromonas sp. 38]|uniref:hypothetical protein n=1 Tax=Alteromonas TaxID=226 RepID=UPI0012F284E1|nr:MULTISPECIES: hypothetical protein [Alteromonas]CAD5285981.1 conserved hypothetical protein [Alteromonas sp. 154]VXB35490.1 conserved hypothetical protein [Alteromonas sp. 38]
MNKNDLDHSQTPIALREINEQIAAQFESSSESDFSELKALLVRRDSVIKEHLETLAPENKQEFANLELDVNNRLKEMAQSLLEEAKDDITRFVRSRSAVKKYK